MMKLCYNLNIAIKDKEILFITHSLIKVKIKYKESNPNYLLSPIKKKFVHPSIKILTWDMYKFITYLVLSYH